MRAKHIDEVLLGVAIGDAFGAGYEMTPRLVIKNRFRWDGYVAHPTHGLARGTYTDDTQMTVANAELLISGQPITLLSLAESFVHCFKRDQRDGYARGFQRFLESIDSGEEFIQKIKPHSTRNGAAMRAIPFGILHDLGSVIVDATKNAQTTHNTPKGIASSVCVASAAHYFFYNIGEPKEVFSYCIDVCSVIDRESAEHFKRVAQMKGVDFSLLCGFEKQFFGIPVDGMRTAGAVLYLISRYYDDPSEALRQAVLLGGDTDSVASIALGIVTSRTGLASLPKFLIEGLENGPYGRDYLVDLGQKFAELAS